MNVKHRVDVRAPQITAKNLRLEHKVALSSHKIIVSSEDIKIHATECMQFMRLSRKNEVMIFFSSCVPPLQSAH
jgi:hypothetical protein